MNDLSAPAKQFIDHIHRTMKDMPFISFKDDMIRQKAIKECLVIIEEVINGQAYPKSADVALEVLNHYSKGSYRYLFVAIYKWLRIEGDSPAKSSSLWELFIKVQDKMSIGTLFYQQEFDVYSHFRE